MTTRRCLMLLLVLTACGPRTGPVTPVPEAETGFRNFMQAVADSNYTGMADNWGTSRGPASQTGTPPDYQQRMAIIQAYLRGIRYRVLANEPVLNQANQRTIQAEISRGNCVLLVPFTMARTGSGKWVVYQFDLEKVGPPARDCSRPQPANPGS